MVRVLSAALNQAAEATFKQQHERDNNPKAEEIVVNFAVGDKSAGVCVQTVQGPGVRISKVLKSGRFYEAGFRPDDLILDLNGTCANDVEGSVRVINSAQKQRGELRVRVLRQHENGGVKVTFRELELPRRSKTAAIAKKDSNVANNEDQADPGVWLEC